MHFLLILLCGLLATFRASAAADDAAPEGAQVFVQLGHTGPVQDLDLSADGQWLAAADINGDLVIWDRASQRELRRFHSPYGVGYHVAYLHDSTRLAWASGTTRDAVVMLVDLDGRTIAVGQGVHSGFITGLAVDDQDRIYSADENGKLVQWSAELKQPLRIFDTRGARISALTLTPDGHLLAGCADGRVLDFDTGASSGGAGREWQAGPEAVSAIAAGRGGVVAVSFGTLKGAAGHSVRVFDRAGELLRELDSGAGRTVSLDFSPDGATLAAVTDLNLRALSSPGFSLEHHQRLLLWHVADWSPAGAYEHGVSGVPALRGRVRYSPDGTRLYVADWDEVPRAFRADRVDAPVETYAGYARSLRLLAPLGPDQVVTSDWYGTPYTGKPYALDDYVAEFGGAQRWGRERIEKLRPSYRSDYSTPSKLYALSRWDLASGRLERVERLQRGAVGSLSPLQNGSVAALATLFPEYVALPPLRSDLVDAALLPPGEPAQQERFGPGPAYTGSEALSERVVGQPLGMPRLAALAGDGVAYAVVADVRDGDAAGEWLALLQRDGKVWTRHAWVRIAAGHATALALSADGTIVWVAGTHVGKDLPGGGPAQPRWLQAHDGHDGTVLQSFELDQGFAPGQVLPLGDGRSAAVAGGPQVQIATLGQTAMKILRPPEPDGLMRALAVSEDGADFAAATPYAIYLWHLADGSLRYRLPNEGAQAQSLCLARRLLLAAMEDGSVMVRERSGGAALARLFRFTSDEWLSITPEGYFAASPHGDRAVNVRVGRRVLGIEQFYDVFYRPDLLQRKLAGRDLGPLIQLTIDDALRRPPPATDLQASPAGPGRVRVEYGAESRGGGVGQLRLYHNGKVVQVDGSVDAAAERRGQGVAVKLVPGENTLAVVATNADASIASRPQSIELNDAEPARGGRVHLVSIGIDHFTSVAPVHPLGYARKDADDLAAALARALARPAPQLPVLQYRLRDAQASDAAVAQLLARLKKVVQPTDVVIWFIASHGLLDDAGHYAIVLHDWDGRARGLLGADTILRASREIPALRQVYILDTCHAGSLDGTVAGLYDARLSVLARNMGLHLLASAGASEEAIDGYHGNGLFTYALLRGLDGAADVNGDHQISVTELADYARDETVRLARLLRQQQRPLALHYGDDIELERIEPATRP